MMTGHKTRRIVEAKLNAVPMCRGHCNERASLSLSEVEGELIGTYACPSGYVSRLMPEANRSKGSVSVRVRIDPIPDKDAILRPEMRARVTFLSAIVITTAADASANSYEALSRSFKYACLLPATGGGSVTWVMRSPGSRTVSRCGVLPGSR